MVPDMVPDLVPDLGPTRCPRIVPIPNGVEVEQFAAPVPRPANIAASIRSKSYLLFLGRLDPRKGIDVLLEAMVLLRGQCDLDLVVAGADRKARR